MPQSGYQGSERCVGAAALDDTMVLGGAGADTTSVCRFQRSVRAPDHRLAEEEEQKKKTKVVKKNLNPYFNESFSLYVPRCCWCLVFDVRLS